MLLVGVVGCLVGLSSSLLVTSPPELAGHILSPILSSLIGDQSLALNVSGFAVYADMRQCRNGLLVVADVSGRVVLLDNTGESVSSSSEEREVLCLQALGVLAVVRMSPELKVPGNAVYWNDPALTHKVTIPLVNVLRDEMRAVTDAVQRNESVAITVLADRNPWKTELYDTVVYLIVMRIALVVLNGLGAVVSLEALIGHISRNKNTIKSGRSVSTLVRTMLVASATELLACTLRAVFCAMGPMFSTTILPYSGNLMLFYLCIALDVSTTLLSVSLFLRWGAFGTQTTWYTKHLNHFLLGFGILFIGASMTFATLQAFYITDQFRMVQFATLVAVICFTICSGVFITSGLRFVSQLKLASELVVNGGRRAHALRKAVRWIVVSGCCLVLQIVGSGLAVSPDMLYRPKGHFVVFALIFYGMSLAGVSQAMAFRPVEGNRLSVVVRVIEMVARPSWKRAQTAETYIME
eukprot:c7956_g1_i1.p1 GENE.c7956_g1_i1~~c7956_g1_i1.p1  ORF type:complete len:467 (+),score=87.69 c7956_g1_i1:17-1417(+)